MCSGKFHIRRDVPSRPQGKSAESAAALDVCLKEVFFFLNKEHYERLKTPSVPKKFLHTTSDTSVCSKLAYLIVCIICDVGFYPSAEQKTVARCQLSSHVKSSKMNKSLSTERE